MTNYPNSIYSPRTKENKAGVEYAPEKTTVGFAEDVTKLDDEVVAIETELGTTPKGVFASVKAFLQYLFDTTQSRARAYLSSGDQTIPTITETKVTLNAKDWDNLGEFDHVTNYRFTAQKAGYYLVCASIYYKLPVDQMTCDIRIKRSGSLVIWITSRASGTSSNTSFISDIVYLTAGQYLEMFAYHNAGVNKDINADRRSTFMAVHRLS